MKNNIRKQFSRLILIGIVTSFAMISCEEDDVFTGSPQGSNLNFITLRGEISTNETDVVAGQQFPVTISLGDNLETPEADLLTFPVDVTVEAISFLPNLNKRARKSFVIPAGENSIESTMPAPSGDATTELPFEFDLQVYLSAIATAPNDDNTRGFEGKQYSIASDTIVLGYGDTPIQGINSKRLGIRFDYLGPYGGTGNNLNIVLKKNGAVMPSQSPNQGVSASATRPINGTLSATSRYEVVNFLDAKQELKISNVTRADSISGVYTVKAPNSNTSANDKPHNFKVGDEVSIENFNGQGSAPLVVQVASVADAYTFTFNYNGAHLFGNSLSFYQPKIVQKDAWSPFLSYFGNDVAVYNGITYYCLRNISANPAGNIYPNIDSVTWTTVKPKIVWADPFLNAPKWTSTLWDNPDTTTIETDNPNTLELETVSQPKPYNINDVYQYNGIVYVCIKQYISASSSTTKPSNDTINWIPAINAYTSDVLTYTSTDTYTIEAYAIRLGGSTNPPAPVDLPYKFSIRFPDETSKVYSSTFSNLAIGTATTAIPKMQIVKTTVQGVSSYVVTHL